MPSNYQQLMVWQQAMDLAEQVYIFTRHFPQEELYGLTSQIRRAAVSIPSNIAEGSQRSSKKDFRHFLMIAKGSSAELETQLLLAMRLDYISNEQFEKFGEKLLSVRRMLSGLASSLTSTSFRTPNSRLQTPTS